MDMTENTKTKQHPSLSTEISCFFELCALMGLGFEELYFTYLGKNVLNKFRQDNGYKDGSYVKIWDGKEDNEVMLNIIKTNPDMEFEDIISALNKEYSSLFV